MLWLVLVIAAAIGAGTGIAKEEKQRNEWYDCIAQKNIDKICNWPRKQSGFYSLKTKN